MWRLLFLLVGGWAVHSLHAETSDPSRGNMSETDQQPTAEPLEEEMDNQENIISQLLGDYDKVKTVSSGSDCVCRCVVRPIKRSDCSRMLDSASPSQDFYSVETITKGTDCKKCECMAPPSAVNPCEGDYRFKKLQEASKDDIKLATIIDLLEGSLYGIDLLKLNSVTTKLLTRVDSMEKVFTQNYSERVREKERAKERAKEKEKDKKVQQQKKKKVVGVERSGSAGFLPKQGKQEGQENKNLQQESLDQRTKRNETRVQKPAKEKNTVFVKGVTFYKAEEVSYDEDKEHRRDRGKNPVLTPNATKPLNTRQEVDHKQPSRTLNMSSPTSLTTPASKTTKESSSAPGSADEAVTLPSILRAAFILKMIQQASAPPQTTAPSITNISPPTGAAAPTAASRTRSRLSWTESPSDQPKTTKNNGVCKDTVASISEPVQLNVYGSIDGAWMKDARGHGKVIYLTDGHYSDSLLEFRNIESFKSGQVSNTYKLPYSFTGTGHVVFNGAFYYNRAFSRDIIRYDLRHRLVSAWTTLHDALLEEEAHKTKTEVEFAVDESGLWLLYPALDTEGFHQEVILLIQLHPRDLQPIRTYRTGLRRGRYGNTFLVCGVLYAVDSMENHFANVTYAFDTHTLTHTVPTLAFTNMHNHTSQLTYCPLDKKLYAWDNGHQMTYDVIFAY